jgi:hypothetical protein
MLSLNDCEWPVSHRDTEETPQSTELIFSLWPLCDLRVSVLNWPYFIFKLKVNTIPRVSLWTVSGQML